MHSKNLGLSIQDWLSSHQRGLVIIVVIINSTRSAWLLLQQLALWQSHSLCRPGRNSHDQHQYPCLPPQQAVQVIEACLHTTAQSYLLKQCWLYRISFSERCAMSPCGPCTAGIVPLTLYATVGLGFICAAACWPCAQAQKSALYCRPVAAPVQPSIFALCVVSDMRICKLVPC